ncbi:MAG: YggS family pyridoxal phosphate-dependent enzyme [Oscillospiraceae bacterium]|nr:YggS family pyridoxal phosphate-dependent enzyme [Oscillospiraceae bacterium]
MLEKTSRDRIAENIARVRYNISELAKSADVGDVRVMAVTKTRSVDEIAVCVENGITLLGENRPQEFRDKLEYFETTGCELHLIGHLQKNKVKYVVGKAHVIESVDSEEILGEISGRAERLGILQDCLIEVNVGGEENKTGLPVEKLDALLEKASVSKGVRIMGLMTVAPNSTESEVERVFEQTRNMFVDIGNKKIDNICMKILSMGMSGDYLLALKHGSNIVRLGREIFRI